MNQKILTILACTLLLSACTKPTTPPKQPEPKKDVFTSIKDAVTRQLLLKCEYVDEDGQKTITYIKGQQVRLSGTGEESDVEGVIKDDKFYLWSKQKKQGMTLDITKMDGAKMGNQPIKSVDDVISVLETKKENCQISTEPNTIFDIPSDITFSDASGFFGN